MLSFYRSPRHLLTALLTLFAPWLFSASGNGQSARAVASSARIVEVRADRTARLAGNVPTWATAEEDLGSLPATQQISNLHLILTRAPQVQAAFTQLLADQQDPTSPRFHQWLTPRQNAELYGVAASDVAAVTGWLRSQGLKVDDVGLGGLFITFSGPASVVENAFATRLHNFRHQNVARYAPTVEPSVPAALADVIQSVAGLSEQMAQTHSHAKALPEITTAARPLYNSGTSTHYTAPGDFNTIYNITPALSAGYSGAGIRVANIIDSRIAAADITGFNSVFGLNVAQPTTIVVPGSTDPGISSDSEGEATLDAQRILGTAPGAGVDILAIGSLSFTNIYSALQYAVGTLNDPIVNMSFGACDSGNVAAQEARFDAYFQAGAAQGISFFVSSGDNAAGGCDGDYTTLPANQVLATNLICASSYATCVGGTQFAEGTGAYWAGANSATKSSATGYIPEGAWNEPTYTSNGKTSFQASGTGGGVTKFAKPSWQVGSGVPADGVRDVPDVSFTSSFHDGYLICQADIGNDCASGTFKYIIFGTSASSPSMAGIAAILNQKLGGRQGNLNPLFYKLAATPANGVFHDVTVATSGVANCGAEAPSMCNNGTPSANALSGGLAGYPVAAGYDLATGLGSMDVANLLAAAGPAIVPPPVVTTSLSLTASANPMTTAQTVTFTATLAAANSTVMPTGTVQFYSNGSGLGGAVPLAAGGSATTPGLTFATAGTYVVTAVYSGDGTFPAASSGAVSLVVKAVAVAVPSFTLTAALSSLSFVSGATTANSETVTLASVNGFGGPVVLSCVVSAGTAAVQPKCSVSPTTVSLAAGGRGTAVVTISTAAARASLVRREAAATIALLLCVVPFRRRRRLRGLAAVVALCGSLGALAGCGSGVNNLVSASSSAGSYAVTVTGTGTAAGASAASTAGVSFTVTVQ